MERDTSNERVIPIEVINNAPDVCDDEIEYEKFVKSLNAKAATGKPPKPERNNSETEKPSSNRASLIITHEDGSTEENECTVTCLGVSSDSQNTTGLQIEELGQDILKDKLSDEKLTVIIPDMSQVVILEADEVTDASFVSTPDIEEQVKPLIKSSSSSDGADSNENWDNKNESVFQVKKVEDIEVSDRISNEDNSIDTYDKAEDPSSTHEVPQSNTSPKETRSSIHELPIKIERETEKSASNEEETIQDVDIAQSASDSSEVLLIADTENRTDGKKSANFENASEVAHINRNDTNHDSESLERHQTNSDETQDKNILGNIKQIPEMVRIIPIKLPDGKLLEKHVVNDDKCNTKPHIEIINNTGSSNIENKDEKNSLPRTIPIKQEKDNNINSSSKNEKELPENHEGKKDPIEANSEMLESNPARTIRSSWSVENLCEKRQISNSIENIIQGSTVERSLKNSEQLMDQVTIDTLPDNRRNSQTLKTYVSDKFCDLSNITINIERNESENLDKSKQTEGTQLGNTCSNSSLGQLSEAKCVENKTIRQIPIQIESIKNEDTERQVSFEENCPGTIEKTTLQEQLKQTSNLIDVDNETKVKYVNQLEHELNATELSVTKTIPIKQIDIDPEIALKKESQKNSMNENKDNQIQDQNSEIDMEKIVRSIPIHREEGYIDSKECYNNEGTKYQLNNFSDKIRPNRSRASSGASNQSLDDNRDQSYKDSSTKSSASGLENIPKVRSVPIKIVDFPNDGVSEVRNENTPQKERNVPIMRVQEESVNANTKDTNETQRSSIIEDSLSNSSPSVDSFHRNEHCIADEKNKENSKSNPPYISVPIIVQTSEDIHVNTQTRNSSTTATNPVLSTHQPDLFSKQNISNSDSSNVAQNNPTRSQTLPSVPTSKPPTAVRSIPILRQSMSDSGAGMPRQQPTTRQRNVSDQPRKDDILQRVHAELEEARTKLTSQANSLSSGLENVPRTYFNRTDPRSRSVESEKRHKGARPKEPRTRTLFKRERSLQDIDKDIETIWRELQELDKPSPGGETDNGRVSRNSNRSQTPLSEQVLVTPSWRTPTPPPHPPPLRSAQTSLSNPNLSKPPNSNPTTQTSSTPRTIWDTPSSHGSRYESSSSSRLSSSWDSKPQYFPTKSSTHFSFLPKTETKPGSITPNYVNQNKTGQTSTSFRNVPIEKMKSTIDEKSFSEKAASKESSQASKEAAETHKVFKSEDTRKSCLKSESVSCGTQSIKTRSPSPSNVKFANLMKTKQKATESPSKTGERGSEPDPPFEWVDFRKSDGEIVKGTILPPLHREDDVVISREVPIINVLLDDAMKEDTNINEKIMKTISKEKEIKVNVPKSVEKGPESPSACDAGTQTEKSEKKGGCLVM